MAQNTADDVIITTTHGPIKGRRHITIYDDAYYSFEKIPFAEPPLGKLRFKAPVPKAHWTEVLDCTEKPLKPLQKNALTNEIEGAENCLYLNVYVKQLKSSQPLPVMVYIYGGGFEKGDPTRDLHGPDYFMMRNVVLITMAYRLGPLGFLSLDDPSVDAPGNAGLKDQLLALQWIKANVANFNGDVKNITLFGQSAGAASTHYMMLTPHAKHLFHKAILMSGNVLCPWALSPLRNLPHRLANVNGYEGADTSKEILEFLQQLPAEELLRPYLLTKEENLDDCLFAFGPVIEPYETSTSIIPKRPQDMLETAWSNEIPIMLGGTSFEGLLMYARVHMAPFLLTELQHSSQHMLPYEVKQKHDVAKQKHFGNKIRDVYFDDTNITMDKVLNYCDYASHKVFWHPKLRTIQARLHHATAPTYLYRFDFDSPDFNHQRIKYCGKELRGVAHVDDLSYIFFGNFAWKLPKDSDEYKTIVRMIDIWTTFAAKSDPNCEQIAHSPWTPLSDANMLHCLNIGHELKIIDLPELDKLLVWNTLYEEE